ncbi:tubulointerstitial nephritis antigen-like [Agrilus planipennis]|uniref:Tubulointerstitial nephritis antigen-like n=1 Tax=Agrilus planipennis TaxID=224129 RepID=A0A7F5RHT5_AGRPL|nr:tubulointerstitial nephritis antigen-like [Agrilus planipennis]XP_025835550.1 tubulointerstitial nephritis antigen-like [Agrilus planipennis]XP_025835553.1 tubulointerstitial nephritis antigen-like [Agrilus planipennis]XP_025835557.1 tubulointerstitial nephritis antigen-like [Agrilus planipennis]XP_025835562.1 tubulointerstitial nephritis antigen-like [Agrilus planipennis]
MEIRQCILFLISSALLALVSAQFSFTGDLPPGPYCPMVGCCGGRKDECSKPIVGTLCYCDDFCENRTHYLHPDVTNNDCCPDYYSFCKGIIPPPEEIFAPECKFNGRKVQWRNSVKSNCNLCKCEKVGQNNFEMLCETDVCIVESDILDTVNSDSRRYGWAASNYSEFWGHKLAEGIAKRLGTLEPHRFVKHMVPLRKHYDPNSLPRNFDAEREWPGKISDIRDQGWCASSWAISTAAVASDRFAIVSKGDEAVSLSPQYLISCNNRGQRSCEGGHLDKAWLFFRKFGIVDENCFPYTGQEETCRFPRKYNLIQSGCVPPFGVNRKEKYKVAPAYRLRNETDIMNDIIKSGPVQATMKVYHDFFLYKSGIYRHTDLSSQDRTGYHSVKIIGWGDEYTENGVEKYWKVANSWGRAWGENGYFRIIRGVNECDIESFVLGAWPLTVDPNTKNDVLKKKK